MSLDEFKDIALKKIEGTRSKEEVTSVLAEIKYSLLKMGFSLPLQTLFWNLFNSELFDMKFSDASVRATALKFVHENLKTIRTEL